MSNKDYVFEYQNYTKVDPSQITLYEGDRSQYNPVPTSVN